MIFACFLTGRRASNILTVTLKSGKNKRMLGLRQGGYLLYFKAKKEGIFKKYILLILLPGLKIFCPINLTKIKN